MSAFANIAVGIYNIVVGIAISLSAFAISLSVFANIAVGMAHRLVSDDDLVHLLRRHARQVLAQLDRADLQIIAG